MKIIAISTLVFTFFLFTCSKKSNVQSLPSAKMVDVVFNRQNANGNCRVYIDMTVAPDKQVSIDFATVAGTALANSDFIPQTGTVTFAPGQKESYIDIVITGDSLRRADQDFSIQLTNPQNCTLNNTKATISIINDGIYLPTDESGYTSPLTYPGYNLVWSDEFDGSTLNTQSWNYETGGGGWGNNELENYTSRSQNVFVSEGNLVIEARKEDYNGDGYTSARLTTAGKKEFQYGRIDIRAKLPVAKGMWPALWMLGSNLLQAGWPACGETDIMELIGTNPGQVVGSFHWKQQSGSEGTINNSYNLSSGDFSQKFHVFSLLWMQDSLKILVDDQPYIAAGSQSIANNVYPFNASSFFIFNVAVGGNWPGPPDNTTAFPQHLFVDYVRVFQ